eukprot:11729000-Alexandrium_andersonii.AAC.1
MLGRRSWSLERCRASRSRTVPEAQEGELVVGRDLAPFQELPNDASGRITCSTKFPQADPAVREQPLPRRQQSLALFAEGWRFEHA